MKNYFDPLINNNVKRTRGKGSPVRFKSSKHIFSHKQQQIKFLTSPNTVIRPNLANAMHYDILKSCILNL